MLLGTELSQFQHLGSFRAPQGHMGHEEEIHSELSKSH